MSEELGALLGGELQRVPAIETGTKLITGVVTAVDTVNLECTVQFATGDPLEGDEETDPIDELTYIIEPAVDDVVYVLQQESTRTIVGKAGVSTPSGTSSVFWEELDRDTLASSGSTVSCAFTAKRYLMVILHVVNSGTTDVRFRVNGDTGNNYAKRASVNGGADATGVSGSGITFAATASPAYSIILDIQNYATKEKMIIGRMVTSGAAGAANAPSRVETVAKWANTAAQISSLEYVDTDTGTLDVGSELIVLGHD